jgi:hypothetical protein
MKAVKQHIRKEIWVDAGCIWLGDPCYVMGDDASSRVKDFGKEFAKNKTDHNVNTPLGDGVGVCVSSGYGDGTYPVDIEINEEGRVSRVTVTFIQEETK